VLTCTLVAPESDFGEGPAETEKLSKRQKQLLKLLDDGLSNRDIAEQLGISEHTVKVHLWRLFRRLDVKAVPKPPSGRVATVLFRFYPPVYCNTDARTASRTRHQANRLPQCFRKSLHYGQIQAKTILLAGLNLGRIKPTIEHRIDRVGSEEDLGYPLRLKNRTR
jgi:DNA-binding CsgD family transcriptional regulator